MTTGRLKRRNSLLAQLRETDNKIEILDDKMILLGEMVRTSTKRKELVIKRRRLVRRLNQ